MKIKNTDFTGDSYTKPFGLKSTENFSILDAVSKVENVCSHI